MANFNMHLAASALVSGALTLLSYSADLLTIQYAVLLWITGTLSGLLPDIDSSHSTSLKIFFYIIGFITAGAIMVYATGKYRIIWIFLGILCVCASLCWIILPVFKKITVHRGNWHTLLAAICASITVTNITWHTNQVSAELAWLSGLFTGTGFFTHLILDELFSFNPARLTFKRSFGSACKPCDMKTPVITGMITLFVSFQLWYLPPWKKFIHITHQLTNALFS